MNMLLIPGFILPLVRAHLSLVVKLGTTAPPGIEAELRGNGRAVYPG
jgi:hypothetical protein